MSETETAPREYKDYPPRDFYYVDKTDQSLVHIGVHDNMLAIPEELLSVNGGPAFWPLVEKEAKRWIDLVAEHPEPGARFAINDTTGSLEWKGDHVDPNWQPDLTQYTPISTAALRTWKLKD